jgi:hypothetical protein
VGQIQALLQHWIAAQPGVVDGVKTLVCDGKTLKVSIDESTCGAARFIPQVSLYANSVGVATAHGTYSTDAGGEIAGLPALLVSRPRNLRSEALELLQDRICSRSPAERS